MQRGNETIITALHVMQTSLIITIIIIITMVMITMITR